MSLIFFLLKLGRSILKLMPDIVAIENCMIRHQGNAITTIRNAYSNYIAFTKQTHSIANVLKATTWFATIPLKILLLYIKTSEYISFDFTFTFYLSFEIRFYLSLLQLKFYVYPRFFYLFRNASVDTHTKRITCFRTVSIALTIHARNC